MRYSTRNMSRQRGAVLLIFALILIIGSTYSLLTKLNSDTNFYIRQSKETQESLRLAKQALIGYAVTYPETVNPNFGPGYLPCPDRDNDGDTDSGPCASTTNTTIGRFPFETLEMAELRDASGARLWYALSDNYRNNPKLEPLNSETDGQLTVDGNGDIVAVVIAPGAPTGNQNRNPADTNILTEIANYLEMANSNIAPLDPNFISVDPTPTNFTDFNDKLITITRQELMEQIEKRVLGEVKTILSAYKTNNGAYPWLSPFSDPKADSRILYGTHTGSDNATSLTDSSTDFKAWGVKKGDIVRNITDGSLSIVTDDDNTVLTVTGIHLGTDNDFDAGDEYYVVARDLGKKLDEKANASSTGSTLVDDNQEFAKLELVPGDIIDNFTDGSSGIVETVTDDTITVRDLTSGSFDNDDEYLVRSYAGEAKSSIPVNDTLLLKDDHKDFIVMGVSVGDVIVNLRDGSIGRVASTTQTTITAASLNFGLENLFDNNDDYILPRYYGIEGTRQGLLSFHREGGYFPSGFDIDWNLPELISAAPNATVSLNTPGTHTDYINNLKQFVQTSNGTTGTITVDVDEGTCIWTLPEIIECKGTHTKYDPTQGQLTSGTNTAIVTDNTKDFVTLGINPGDIVQNYDDETFVASGIASVGSSGTTLVDLLTDFSVADPVGLYNFLIRNTSYAGPNKSQGILVEIDAPNTLMVDDYSGWDVDPVAFNAGDGWSAYTPAKTVVSAVATTTLTTNQLSAAVTDFDTQEFYRVKSATGKLTSTAPHATAGSTGTTLIDIGQDFTAGTPVIQVGDVVHNVTDDSWGEITAVTATTITATLYDSVGTTTTFDVGDSYEVYYAYMNSRRYEFRLRFNGTTVTNAVNGSRKRDVCLGYTNCTGTASNVSLPFYNLGSSGTATDSLGLTLEDDPGAPHFKDLRIYPGHVVVNTTDGSNGIITTRDTDKQVSVNELNDGAENDFDNGESYYITAPVVTIKDYDASETELSSAAVSIPSGGAQGSIKVSNIDYYLRETTNELPGWFIANKWHHLVYVAFSAGDAPGAAAACVAGTDCLTLNGAGTPSDNKNALVVAAGMEINTTLDSNCNNIASTAQNRTNATINEYYESGNCNAGDDGFQKQFGTNTFNDQVRVVEPSP
jgi:hypothetical protein